MSPRHLRAGRAVAAATTATVIAGTSHTLAAEGPPPIILLLAATVLATPVTLLLIGRRLSFGRTLATVAAAQAIYHLAFALVAPGATSGSVSAAGHLHHVPLPLAEGAVAAVPDAPMLGAHALAAIITALLLHRGERMLHALGCGVRALLARARPALPPLRAAMPHFAIDGPAWTVRPRPASGCSSRGPPALVAAV
ncbi:hypothetical protein FBY40_1654 [Microbacterium sp. SLBN-154]|uniref:hypothetical protein n=1 Tax=Microbacterium sp. SLBN-154 TaxID=2768458 RepID=UPI00114E7FB3|nr:hypothetical protein [Microbacterium sp. SLBN-154]TQK19161.1 hypothetical protein FBY40_1654 [Microbacterium sp. SLBN-154]